MGIAAVIVGVEKGEVRPNAYDWNSSIFNGTLHVRMAGVTFIFDDIQEGIDALTTLATVPPSGSTEADSDEADSDECGTCGGYGCSDCAPSDFDGADARGDR